MILRYTYDIKYSTYKINIYKKGKIRRKATCQATQ